MSEIPEFKNFDELKKFLDKKEKKVQAPRRSSKRKPAKKDTSVITKEIDPALVYKTIHFYVRKADSLNEILKDGRQELQASGDGTVIFCHDHHFGEPCVDLCREL